MLILLKPDLLWAIESFKSPSWQLHPKPFKNQSRPFFNRMMNPLLQQLFRHELCLQIRRKHTEPSSLFGHCINITSWTFVCVHYIAHSHQRHIEDLCNTSVCLFWFTVHVSAKIHSNNQLSSFGTIRYVFMSFNPLCKGFNSFGFLLDFAWFFHVKFLDKTL
jgi:hypothetical protein